MNKKDVTEYIGEPVNSFDVLETLKTLFNKPFSMSRQDAAAYIGVGLNVLDELDIPKTRIKNRIFYLRSVLEKWLIDNTDFETTAAKNEQRKG